MNEQEKDLSKLGEAWFVTGTDTEVGKTVVSAALLEAAANIGKVTAGYKPVASGSEWRNGELRNTDALALQSASSISLSYVEVNPYTFEEPTSPHIISADEGKPIAFSVMSTGLRALRKKANWVLVEGAGGWYTPLSESTSFAQWAQQEQLPVILVVGVKLGCINHALLTAQAVQQSGLRLGGWVANCVIEPGPRHAEYMATLRRLLPVACLGEIPHLPQANAKTLARYLDLSSLY